jgi:hypothetical protein
VCPERGQRRVVVHTYSPPYAKRFSSLNSANRPGGILQVVAANLLKIAARFWANTSPRFYEHPPFYGAAGGGQFLLVVCCLF